MVQTNNEEIGNLAKPRRVNHSNNLSQYLASIPEKMKISLKSNYK
jgi:hypothetical protein